MKTLYCAGCSVKVAEIQSGSKLKKGMTALCRSCETKRKASDLACLGKKKNDLGDMFRGMMG